MTRTGIVESVKDGRVSVLLSDASCEGCTTPCGACNRKRPAQRAEVDESFSVKVGDSVELECSSAGVLLACVLLFLVPVLLFVFVDLFLLPRLGEARAALFAGGAALLSFFLFGALFSRKGFRRKNAFVLSRILSDNKSEKELDKL